jgi:hypothetical protein
VQWLGVEWRGVEGSGSSERGLSGDIDTEVLVEVDLFSAKGVKISIFHAVVVANCKEEF